MVMCRESAGPRKGEVGQAASQSLELPSWPNCLPILPTNTAPSRRPRCWMRVSFDLDEGFQFELSQSMRGSVLEKVLLPQIQKSMWDVANSGTRSHYGVNRLKRSSEPQPSSLFKCQYTSEDKDDSTSFSEARVRLIPLEIGKKELLVKFYEMAFRAIQQKGCRHIAKAFIKTIEPRKQVKHPYNGGKDASGKKGDPEDTKPDWWPTGVPHKEPDHLSKPARLHLLVYIFMELYQSRRITADLLKEAGKDVQRALDPVQLKILDDIIEVRDMQDSYMDGQIDANTVVYVRDHAAIVKARKASKAKKVQKKIKRSPDTSPETPSSEGTTERPSKCIRLGSQEEDAAPLIATLEVSTAYPASSGSMAVFPTAQPIEQPNELPASLRFPNPPDFMCAPMEGQLSLQTSLSAQQVPISGQQIPSSISPWNYQMMGGPVDYGSNSHLDYLLSPSSTPLAPHPHSGTAPGSSDLPPLPDLHGARAQPHLEQMALASPAFRTGSLSHPNIHSHYANGTPPNYK